MNNKTVSNLGFIGISLLLFTLIFGGQLIENYDITNQFIMRPLDSAELQKSNNGGNSYITQLY